MRRLKKYLLALIPTLLLAAPACVSGPKPKPSVGCKARVNPLLDKNACQPD